MIPGVKESRHMRPTRKHRPAIWENMLGTVYAMNDQRVTQYFDYRYEDALKFAGVNEEGRDARTFKMFEHVRYAERGENPRYGKLVLWVIDGRYLRETDFNVGDRVRYGMRAVGTIVSLGKETARVALDHLDGEVHTLSLYHIEKEQ